MANDNTPFGLWVPAPGGGRSIAYFVGRIEPEESAMYIETPDKGEIKVPLNFSAQDFLYSDFFRVIYDSATGSVTPVPMPVTYADPIRDPGVANLVSAGVRWASQATDALNNMTSNITQALNAGSLPASLYQEIEDTRKKWVDQNAGMLGGAPVTSAPLAPKASVNLIEGGKRIVFPVRLRVGNRMTKESSRVDPGAEISVIMPNTAEYLQAPTVGTVELGGFTGGSAVVPVVRIDAIVGKNCVIPTNAAVSPLVRQQTGKNFLVGVDLFLEAKKNGVLMI